MEKKGEKLNNTNTQNIQALTPSPLERVGVRLYETSNSHIKSQFKIPAKAGVIRFELDYPKRRAMGFIWHQRKRKDIFS